MRFVRALQLAMVSSPLARELASLEMQRTLIWVHRAVGVTSIVLVTALPDNEAARPPCRHPRAFAVERRGADRLWTIGSNEFATAAGVALATLLMLAARVVHPPAGINAFLIPAYAISAS